MSEAPQAQADQEWSRTLKGLGTLIERITPWLLELGSWIFGALIAFSLLVLASLLTVGPVDRAVLVATAAFALALPPDVAGLLLLRLAVDMSKVRLDDVATQAFTEAGFRAEDVMPAGDIERAMNRRTKSVLAYCYAILTVSILVTLVGVTAAFWHMAWWIGVMFLAMVGVSIGVLLAAFASSPSARRSKA